MGVNRVVSRLARGGDVRVFCVAGAGAEDDVRMLRLRDEIRLRPTPRAANILLLAGDLDPGLVSPALVAHDALAPPRATVWWRLGAQTSLVTRNFPGAVMAEDGDVVETLRRTQRELLDRARGEPPLLPDVEPALWRGVGPYGQGGKAMTGGVPYGRPMAQRADDRDGLKLDQLPVRVGPLFAPWPTGLALDLTLQGDVIQATTVENFAAARPASSVFRRALARPVPVRALELARVKSHLHWLSHAAAIGGPSSFAERILRLATRITPGDADTVHELERSLRRRGFLGWHTRGVGVVGRDEAGDATGPVARASGSPHDARTEEGAYTRLGFEPVMQDGGDSSARWLQRLREAAQALDLAARAGDAVSGGDGRIEAPRGLLTHDASPSQALIELIPALVVGMEWGDAVSTIVSLDLDMREAHVNQAATAA